MTQTIPTSEVLYRAADHIEERGWVRGADGWPGLGRENKGLCLEGGIMAALGTNFCDADPVAMQSCPTYRAVADYLGREPLWRWNDEPARTASEVIEVLRATALIEAAKESRHVEARVSS